MYSMTYKYAVSIDDKGEQVKINPLGGLHTEFIEDDKMHKITDTEDVHINLVQLTSSDFELIITEVVEDYYPSAKFDDICEDTLMRLKLGSACAVANDTKLSYELLKILTEE